MAAYLFSHVRWWVWEKGREKWRFLWKALPSPMHGACVASGLTRYYDVGCNEQSLRFSPIYGRRTRFCVIWIIGSTRIINGLKLFPRSVDVLELFKPFIGSLLTLYDFIRRQGRWSMSIKEHYWLQFQSNVLCYRARLSPWCANETIIWKLWVLHRCTLCGVNLFNLRNFIRLNSNIFHYFHSCTSWVPFPAVMWACWSLPAATWNGYRRCKMAIRGRVEKTQLGGRGDCLAKGPPSKV